MNLVVDTSVIVAALVNEPERRRIASSTEGAVLIAPASVHWEVGNALAAMLKRNRVKLAQVKLALRTYEQIPIRFVDIDLAQAMDIAAKYDLYAYDAYIIECALENRCRLISLDKRLLQAAAKARVSATEITP